MPRSLRVVPHAQANGIDLYYERWGDGPRLLFLNGSGSSIATSELLIKLFTSDFEVLVHDQRGLGESEIPAGPYTMADYAADTARSRRTAACCGALPTSSSPGDAKALDSLLRPSGWPHIRATARSPT